MHKIRVESEGIEIAIKAEFFDNPTVGEILKFLPIESKVNTWGAEIYFNTEITAPVENPTTNVEVGDIAYWPEGKCLCIFFGRTPMSSTDKPVPASEVVIMGKTLGDLTLLRKIKAGAKVIVE